MSPSIVLWLGQKSLRQTSCLAHCSLTSTNIIHPNTTFHRNENNNLNLTPTACQKLLTLTSVT